ncbi:MAG TPA: glycosyltransferase family 4 protein [Myxococcaceae bacterium]|nr:glycosyltransferase family 4 protein [Myxococcaceae bacterium]
MLVVHTHLHRRRTGVTSHVEAVVRGLGPEVEARVLGYGVERALPRIGPLALLRRSRREQVVVHAHRNPEVLLILLLRLLGARLRLVFTRHGAGRPSWLTRALLSRADRVVALTRLAADALDVASKVIPHGVDTTRFTPPGDRSDAKRRLGLTPAPTVGVVGRIRPPKGQGDFVDAFVRVAPGHPDAQALVAGLAKPGDQGFVESLRQRAGGRLHVLGPTDQVETLFQALDIVVQPSHAESFSLVLLEAMASGCCVIAAHLPHYPELLEDGVTGLLYPVGDVEALAAQLRRVLEDPALAASLGAAAAAKVARHHGLTTQVRALRAFYAELAAAPARA